MINSKCAHILTHSINDFDKIKTYIIENDKHHYSYTPKERKNINLIIRGINHTYTSDEVLHEIKELNLDNLNVIKCTEFKTRKSLDNDRKLDLFLLTLSHGSDTKELVKVRYLLNQRVYFETINRSRDCTQCHRCQRFGHTANNCTMIPRCVKCRENHLTKDCTNIKTIKQTKVDPKTGVTTSETITIPTCVNCGLEGHPANFRLCEARIKYLKNISIRQEQSQITQKQKRIFQRQTVNNYYQKETSMADALKSNNSTFHSSTNNNTNNLDFFEKECQTTFNDSLSNLVRKVNSFKPRYMNISNPDDKKIALVSFILSIC